ncbi:MAG TPA: TetR family transcriptional regulator C-terminal domain-containing protein, partial [Acidimicrobiales bacterium]
ATQHEGFVARLDAVLDAAVALNGEDSSLAPFISNVASEAARNPDLGARLTPLVTSARSFFAGVVEEAAGAGELAPDVSPQAVVDMINALLSGLARFSELYQTGDRHAHATAALKRLIDGTLVQPTSRQRSGARPAR